MEGSTYREHLMAAQRRSGRVPERLANAPKLPSGCDVLWRDFMTLRGMAGSNGFGPSRIGFHDIDGYQRVKRIRLQPWEIEAIRQADSAYIELRSKEKAK